MSRLLPPPTDFQVRGGDGVRPDLLHAAGAERGARSHGGLHRLQRRSGQQPDGQ